MRTFVTEPLVLALFSELLLPSYPVRYLIPYSSLQELYLFRNERLSEDEEEQNVMMENITILIDFFENPFVKKKVDSVASIPWAVSKPILYHEQVSFQVVNSTESAEFGDEFDPIETELLLLAAKENVPLLIEDPSIQQRIIDYDVSVQVYDVADFEFALEEDLSGGKPVVEAVSSSYLPALILGSFLFVIIAAFVLSFTK